MSIGYMSWPQCGTPDGIISNAQVAKVSLPQANGKTNPTYISGFTDAWFSDVDTGSFHSGHSAQGIGLSLSHEHLTVSEPGSVHCSPLMGARV